MDSHDDNKSRRPASALLVLLLLVGVDTAAVALTHSLSDCHGVASPCLHAVGALFGAVVRYYCPLVHGCPAFRSCCCIFQAFSLPFDYVDYSARSVCSNTSIGWANTMGFCPRKPQ